MSVHVHLVLTYCRSTETNLPFPFYNKSPPEDIVEMHSGHFILKVLTVLNITHILNIYHSAHISYPLKIILHNYGYKHPIMCTYSSCKKQWVLLSTHTLHFAFHLPISCCHFNSCIDTFLTFKVFDDRSIVRISNLSSRSTTLSECLQDFADTVPSVQDWLLQSGNSDQIVIFWRMSQYSITQKQ